jgi:hypothetical protein
LHFVIVNRIIWSQSVNLINNKNYQFSFVSNTANPNTETSMPTKIQIRIFNGSTSQVIAIRTYSSKEMSSKFNYLISSFLGATGTYTIAIEQIEFFGVFYHDLIFDDIELNVINITPCDFFTQFIPFPASQNTAAGTFYTLNNSITINSSKTWTDCDISVTNNLAQITVGNGATLIIDRCRIHGCSNMWKGIVVQSGGRLIIRNESLIEDALIAVKMLPSGLPNALLVRKTTFNKNLEGIVYEPYSTSTTYPNNIGLSVFTSRTIPVTACKPPNWTTTTLLLESTIPNNSLASPYLLQNLPVIALNNGTVKPQNHVRCTQVGRSDGTVASPILTYIRLNHTDTFGIIYDNAVNGIYADNSNIEVVRLNVFQYCDNGVYLRKSADVANGTSALKLFGARIGSNQFNLMENYFYDNNIGINNYDYAYPDFRNNSIRSLQNSTANFIATDWPPLPVTNSLIGNKGISNFAWANANCIITNNEIFNVNTGIHFFNGLGIFWVFPMNAGNTNIYGNKIWDKPAGNSTATAYIGEAIYAGFFAMPYSGFINHISMFSTKIETNDIKDVFRGINYGGFSWWKHHSSIASNTITLKRHPSMHPGGTQHGIWGAYNNHSFIRSNTVTGNEPSPTEQNNTFTQIYTNNLLGVKARQANYRIDNNWRNYISCNKSQGGFFGFEFNGGSSVNTRWMILNQMNNAHYYGYFLNNGAVIGTQGSPTFPINNIWNFTPPVGSSSKHTFVYNTIATNSILHLNGNSLTLPSSNDRWPTLFAPYKDFPTQQSMFTNTATPSTNCIQAPNGPFSSWLNDYTAMDQAVSSSGFGYSSSAASLNYNNKMNIYKVCKTDSGYSTATAAVTAFFNAANAPTSAYRKMQDIEEAIGAANYTNAQTLTNAFAPSNETETNQKAYYNLAIAYGSTGSLSPANKAALLALAIKCPFTQGPCVYQARLMYNMDNMLANQALYPFYDDCNASGLYKKEEVYAEALSDNKIFIYPNPTNGTYYIYFADGTIKQAKITILDNLGKVASVLTKEVINNVAFCEVHLPSGVYSIKIEYSFGQSVIKKLIIN